MNIHLQGFPGRELVNGHTEQKPQGIRRQVSPF